jgi:hypothetical protein
VSWKQERGRVAALSRSRTADDPDLIAARQRLIEGRTAAYIEKVLAQAPTLTDEQRTRLAELLAPVRGGAGHAT